MVFRLILVLLFSAISINFLCSQSSSYTPLNSIYDGDVLLMDLSEQLKADIESLPSKEKKSIGEIYTKRTTSIQKNISDQHYLFDNYINEYFDELFNTILAGNPEIPKDQLRLLISRYPWPNAACFGEGTFVINIGLIRRLENRDQAAFVICHELAHYMDNHVNDAIKERTRKLKALENSKEIKKLEKQEYGRYDALLNLMQGLVYDDRKHSRLHEAEADSLGLKYYLKAGFDPKEALKVMDILDHIDEQKYAEKVGLEQIFNTEKFPFKAKWLRGKSAGLSQMNAKPEEDWDADSLKTHPDCQARLKLLEKQISTFEFSPLEKEIEATTFDTLVDQCDFEVVEVFYDFQDYGRTIYYACQLLSKYPKNAYLKACIGKSLFHIYEAQEAHELSEYVQMPGKQKPAYKQVLQFIHNLRLPEIKRLNYHFLNKDRAILQYDSEYLYALWLAAYLMEKEEEMDVLKIQYLRDFPYGKYSEFFKESK